NAELAKTVAAADHRVAERAELLAGLDGCLFERAAEIGEAFFVDRVRVAAALLVGAVQELEFLKEVGAEEGAPGGPDERLGQFAETVVGVLTAGREDLDVLEAVLIEHLAEVRRVLSEAAGALGGRHEAGDALRVRAGLLEDLHEVADGDLGRVAFVA